jgi:hypothetical protein
MATINVFYRDGPTRMVVLRPPTNRSSTCIVFAVQASASSATASSSLTRGHNQVSVYFQPSESINFSALKPLVQRPVFGCIGVVAAAEGAALVLLRVYLLLPFFLSLS